LTKNASPQRIARVKSQGSYQGKGPQGNRREGLEKKMGLKKEGEKGRTLKKRGLGTTGGVDFKERTEIEGGDTEGGIRNFWGRIK